MQITKEDKDNNLNAVLKLKVEKQDYEERVEKSLQDYRKKVSLNGFRKGRVPLGLVKKMYGRSILVDEVNKLISEKISEYIKQEDLNILGEPLPSEDQQEKLDFDNQEEFEFAFDIALSPDIDMEQLASVTVPYYNITVDEQLIEDTIEEHKKKTGDHIAVEETEEKDIVKGELVELDNEGNIKEDGIKKEDALISVELIKDDAIKNKFIGSHNEDVIQFNLKTALPNDTEVSSLLNMNKEDIENLTSDFQLTISEIKRFQKGEVNQHLFDTIYGEGQINSEEEYRERIKNDLKENFEKESDFKFVTDVRETLLKDLDFELPEDFLKRYFVEKEEKLTSDNIDSEFENMRESLKWEIISGKITKEFNITVSEEEVKEQAKKVLMSQVQQYGLGMDSLPEDFFDNYANDILQKKEERERIESSKKEEKIGIALKDKVQLDTKDISYEEFKNMMQSQEESSGEAAESQESETQVTEEQENTEDAEVSEEQNADENTAQSEDNSQEKDQKESNQ